MRGDCVRGVCGILAVLCVGAGCICASVPGPSSPPRDMKASIHAQVGKYDSVSTLSTLPALPCVAINQARMLQLTRFGYRFGEQRKLLCKPMAEMLAVLEYKHKGTQ